MKKNILLLLIIICALNKSNYAQVIVEPGEGTLAKAIENAQPGEILQLKPGAVYSNSTTFGSIKFPLTIEVVPGSNQKAIIQPSDTVSSSFYFFMILDGASLNLSGLEITGIANSKMNGKSMFVFDGSPDPTKARLGTIKIDNCIFHDFIDNVFHGMKEAMQKGMVQDSMIINNVIVYNVDAFLQYKHVSLRYLELKNSTMYKLGSMAVKIGKEKYRGYTHISPKGIIDHCTMNDMGGVNEHGHIQIDDAFNTIVVSNCILSHSQAPDKQPGLFMNSPMVDTAAIVKNTCFWEAGGPVSSNPPYWPGYVFSDSITMNPGYRDAENGDFALPDNSALVTFGADGTQIGDMRWGTYDATGIALNEISVHEFLLFQNYPNPFNPSTTIKYSIPGGRAFSSVSIRIFDMLGREVALLENSRKTPGDYQVTFDGSNLPSGVYFCRLNYGNLSLSKKLVLMK